MTEYNNARFKVQMKARILRGIAHAFSEMQDEIKVEVGPLGWKIGVVDPAHVAMMVMELRAKTMFEEYKVTQEGNIGFNLEYLCDIVTGLKDDDLVTIQAGVDGKDNPRFEFHFGSVVEKHSPADISMVSEPKIPRLELPVEFVIPFSKVQDIIHGLGVGKVSDHIRIKAYDNEGIEFETEGDVRKRNIKLPKDLLEGLSFATKQSSKLMDDRLLDSEEIGSEIESLYPEDYFQTPFFKRGAKGWRHFFGRGKELNLVTFHMGNEYPIKIVAGDSESILLMYLLAPRIESD